MNWYIMLVANSGITRKSSSVDKATDIGFEFLRSLDEKQILIQGKMTPEMLENSLVKSSLEYGYAYAAISISELVRFLGREKYVSTLPGLLTDLYDSPTFRTGGGTLQRGSTEFHNVYVCFLSASTPTWLLRAINPDVVEGGFTSRVIFVVSDKPKQLVAWPRDREYDTRIFCDRMLNIRRTAKKVSNITITRNALDTFTAWYNSRSRHIDSFRATFESREDAHVLRVAACLTINEDIWEIQQRHIAPSIELIEHVKQAGAQIFEGAGSSSKIVIGLDKLREIFILAGTNGVIKSILTKKLERYFDSKTLDIVLEIMHEMGLVQRFEKVKLGKGRPATLYRGTKSLLDEEVLNQLMEKMEPVL